MADARGAWSETGEKLTDLGRKLKVHYEEHHGGEGQQSRQELADAAKRVGSAVQDAFEAIGAAARDKSVQADVRAAGQSLVEALGATFGQASEEVRRVLSERKGDVGHSATTPAPPAPEAPPATDGPSATAVPEATPAPSTSPVASPADDPLASEPPTPAAGPSGADGEQPPKVEPWGTP
jgi:hypothetical protein